MRYRLPILFSQQTFIWLVVLLSQSTFAAESTVTFNKDIFPIFQEKCHECHRPGAIAPMSLVTYEQARPWAESIRKEVVAKRMPPFHADGPIGYYRNDIRLSAIEIQTVLDWVDGGTKQGNQVDLPEPKVWTNEEWPLEQPDLILKLPAVTPSPESTEEWWTLYSDYVFPEDTWIRGAHLAVNKESAIHHAHLLVGEPNSPFPQDGKVRDIERSMSSPLETWFPGLTQSLLPERLGELIPKGSRIVVQVHFGPNEEGRSEQPAIGIYFANGEIETTQAILGPKRVPLKVPPYDSDYTLQSRNTFNVSGTITHFQSHMHVRGKSSRIVLHYPEGGSEVVFDLPRFNFDWQRYYYLAQPQWVPQGTVAEFIGTWDNSIENPHNPDPSQSVGPGKSTTDEMFGLHIYYTPDLKLPKTFVVEDGRVVGSRDNPDEGPWILFWKTVVDRDWLAEKLKLSPNAAVVGGDGAIAP